MNDLDYLSLLERIQGIFYRLRDALNLAQVGFNLTFHRERDDLDHEGSRTMAEIHPSWQYANANLHIYVPSFEDKDDDEIASVLIHELVHYWLHPISRYGSSKEYDMLEERTCTDIAAGFKSAIQSSADEVATHWKREIKKTEKKLAKLSKQLAVVA